MIMMMIIIHGSNISFTIRSFLISSEALHRHRNKNTGPSKDIYEEWSWVMTQFHALGFKNLHAHKTDNDCTFILPYFSVLFVLVSHTKTPIACLQKYNFWQKTLLCQSLLFSCPVTTWYMFITLSWTDANSMYCCSPSGFASLFCVFNTFKKLMKLFTFSSLHCFFFSELLTFLQGAALPFQPLYFPKRMSQFGQ